MAIFGVPILGLLNKLRRVAGHLHLTVPPTSCPCVPRLLSSSAGNAALHSIGPCPPVFPRFPLTSAPNRSQSVLSAESHLPVTHLKNSICRLLFSWSYGLLSPETLYFQTHLRCPPRVCPQTAFPEDSDVDWPTTHTYTLHYLAIADSYALFVLLFALPSFVFNTLQTLLAKYRGGDTPLIPRLGSTQFSVFSVPLGRRFTPNRH